MKLYSRNAVIDVDMWDNYKASISSNLENGVDLEHCISLAALEQLPQQKPIGQSRFKPLFINLPLIRRLRKRCRVSHIRMSGRHGCISLID